MATYTGLNATSGTETFSADTDGEGKVPRKVDVGANAKLVEIRDKLGAIAAIAAHGVALAIARMQTLAAIQMFNGTTLDLVTGDTANGVDVDVTRLPSLPAGTNNIGRVTTALDYEEGDAWISKPSNVGTSDVIARAVLRDMNELRMHFHLPADFVGSLTLEGSIDNGANYYAESPDASVVKGLGANATLAANVITFNGAGAAVHVMVPYDSPSPTIRATLTHTGGGSATAATYTASYFARAA